ncbi:NAD(P)/FAD-dependent oxidoreductase [Winogradskyella ursingii]|uniref:NAD(P)/FAD-dependent oxidoreductase n=1 Tax=Winogradskyella ursingii TaxID=2686079 RepID=UPI0015C9AACB|nr:FAD-binding oxidoreductase [Winogradskyella ursingii]
MKQTDYIIVGCGLASIAFCEQLRAQNKSFLVYDDKSQKSSIVAAGLYNPVVLKRFTAVWKAKEQLDLALSMYTKIENDLNIKIDYKLKILRRLASIEEQNLWFTASDKPALEPFLSTKIIKNQNNCIDAPFGFGEVLNGGRIDTHTLIVNYKSFLAQNNQLKEERFDYNFLNLSQNEINYANIETQHIVFSEGVGVKQNPYFKDLPVRGNKGEILTIKAPKLKMAEVIKSSVFLIPLGNNLYNVGSTYDREYKSNTPTESAKSELISKLKTFLKCEFEVINHVAGVRPTVKDRRPIVGTHPNYKGLHILNGLGSRGVMIAPYVAKQLFSHIEKNKDLDKEIDVNRFS